MRVIVCGLGQAGYRVAMLLARLGEEVTAVTFEAREEIAENVSELGCKIIYGDARNERNLVEAGIETADAIIICTDNDLANIEVSLDARRLNRNARIVVRIFDQVLARRLEDTLGVQRALAMSMISAPVFAAAAMGESVRGTFSIEGDSYVVGRVERQLVDSNADGTEFLQIHEDSAAELVEVLCDQAAFSTLNGRPSERPKTKRSQRWRTLLTFASPVEIIRTFRDIWRNAPGPLKGVAAVIAFLTTVSVFVFHYGMHLSALDSVYFVITTVTTVGYGDITPKDQEPWLKVYGCLLMLLGSAFVAAIYSIITDFVVSLKFDQMLGRSRVTSAEHVIVIGLGSVGYRTVNELRRLQLEVVAVDVKPDAQFRGSIDPDVPFVAGDARDPDTLKRAGIDKATAVLSLTENDAVNLSVGLMAKQLNPEARSVVRLFNAQFAEKVMGAMEVDSAMSASRIAAPSFVGAALYDGVLFCYVDGNRFVTVRSGRNDKAADKATRHLSWRATGKDSSITVTTRNLADHTTTL